MKHVLTRQPSQLRRPFWFDTECLVYVSYSSHLFQGAKVILMVCKVSLNTDFGISRPRTMHLALEQKQAYNSP